MGRLEIVFSGPATLLEPSKLHKDNALDEIETWMSKADSAIVGGMRKKCVENRARPLWARCSATSFAISGHILISGLMA